MRTVLIAATACLTAGTFFGAERLMSSNAETVALDQKAAVQAAVETQLKQSNQGFVDQIAALKEAGASTTAQIGTLTSNVETLTAKRNELSLQLITAQDQANASLARVTEIEAMYDGLVEKVSVQEATIAQKNGELDALRTKAEAAGSEGASQTKVAALSNQLKARDAMIAELKDAVQAAKSAQPEPVAQNTNAAELNSAKARASAFSAALRAVNSKVSARDETIAALEKKLSETGALTQTTTAETVVGEPVQASSASQEEQSVRIAALDAQIADLTQIVETQESAIANLRLGLGDGPVEPMEMAEICIARASGILESTQITFGTGTSSISRNSIATLESLRDLAIGCNNDDVIIEIGGHTDSFGAEADNQALSEARAESVKEFLVERGIPAENMIAVGFGETDPVAGNDTPTGRAANRRITFMWQMREKAEPVEPETTTVDG